MNTTLSTLFLIAGSTGAAMSNGLLVCGFVLFWKRQETGKLRLVTFSRVAPNASSLPAVVARQESAERLLWAVGTVQYDLRVHCYLCFVLMA
jgi:predicted permease